jgi:Protein of unknown function (DUF3289)
MLSAMVYTCLSNPKKLSTIFGHSPKLFKIAVSDLLRCNWELFVYRLFCQNRHSSNSMAGPVQESKSPAPKSAEQESKGSMSMSPPAFGLTAGSPTDGNGKTVQRQQAPTTESSYLWQGLVNKAGAGYFKAPKADSSQAIAPVMEVSELVLVLEEQATGWLKVSRHAGDGSDSVGYINKADVNKMPGQIGHSRHKVGRNNEDTDKHHDLKSGDETKEVIDGINWSFWEETGATDDQLFDRMTDMCTTIFSTGDLQTNIIAMIAHFRGNTGSNYTNPILTKAASAHESTGRFLAGLDKEFTQKIKDSGGDASKMNAESLKQMANPHFNTWSDTAGGLQIAVNDVWAYDINLDSYDRAGDQFEALVTLNLHDHFGLDRPDVEKIYGQLRGFRAWYVLQHLRGYKPFVVDIPVSHRIKGSIK